MIRGYNEAFSKALQHFMLDEGLRTGVLAEILHMSDCAVSHWRAGRVVPSLPVFADMVVKTGMTPDQVYEVLTGRRYGHNN